MGNNLTKLEHEAVEIILKALQSEKGNSQVEENLGPLNENVAAVK